MTLANPMPTDLTLRDSCAATRRRDPIKMAIIAMHPVQYHSPLYQTICNSPAFDGRVIYLDKVGLEGSYDKEFATIIEWDIPLLERHAYEFLKNHSWNNQGGFFSRINLGLFAAVERGGFDAILIQGYSILSFWIALFASRNRGIKVVWRGEVTLKPSDKSSGARQRIRNAMVRSFLKRCDAVMYTCTGNKEFLVHHGLPEEDLFPFYCAVDNHFFRAEYARLAPQSAELRQSLGIPEDNMVVLFCGRLTERKRPKDVLEALRRAGSNGLTFLIMGDGPQRSEILEFARLHGVHTVHLGFVNQSQISQYYTIADIFCLLSEYDPSPKALNEAMNFSLVPIVTKTVGTSKDLIKCGETGFMVSLGDTEAVARHISQLRADPPLRAQMARAAQNHVETFSFSANAESLEQACRFAIERKERVT